MKSLLLLGCAALLVACGSSSGNYDGPAASLSPGTSQTPQQPSDSLAPVNDQQPAVNDQQPATSSGTSSMTCAQLAAAVTARGCVVSSQDIAECEQEMVANAPCAAQWQGYLACFLAHFTCNDNGNPTAGDACNDVEQALGSCLDNTQVTPQPGGTCQSPACNNCADTCSLCECESMQVDIDCTPYC